MSRRVGTENLWVYCRPLGRCRRMAGEIAQPVVSLMLRCQHLAPAHAGGENGNPVFAGLISAGLCQYGPIIGLGQILWHAPTGPVVRTQSRLGQDVSLLRRQREPAHSFGVVL